MLALYKKSLRATFVWFFLLALGVQAYAQSSTIPDLSTAPADPTGAVVPDATVEIHNQ